MAATKKTEQEEKETEIKDSAVKTDESVTEEKKVEKSEDESGYYTTCSLTSLIGVIGPDQKVEHSHFHGGFETLLDLEKRGLVVEK